MVLFFRRDTSGWFFIFILLILWGCGTKDYKLAKNFQRLSFETKHSRQSESLVYDRQGFAWRGGHLAEDNKIAKQITRGRGIIVDGEALFYLKPGQSGAKGILFNIFVNCKMNDLSVEVIIKRGGTNIFKKTLKKFKSHRLFERIQREMDFLPEDEIVVRGRGAGIIVVSDAVIYDIIPREERKYIFFIAVDNCRKDVIGKRRNGIDLTPHINQLIADGVYFENIYAQSSWTYPSFMSMFSGLYEHNLQLNKKSILSPKKPFLIEALAEDFITVNYNGGAWMQAIYGNSRGFDRISQIAGAEAEEGGRRLFARAKEYLEGNHIPDLFMFLHTYHVHSPFTPTQKFLNQINPKSEFSRLRNFVCQNIYKSIVSEKKKQGLIDLYEAEVMEFDFYLGKFIKYLKSEVIYDQSLIVLVSDHGEEFFEHRGWFHGHSLYNELLAIPMIIKFPANQYAGKKVKGLGGLLDIFPTLMDYYHMPVSAAIDARSLLPMVKSNRKIRDRVWSSTACAMLPWIPPRVGVIFENFKLIYNSPYTKEALEYYGKNGLPPVYQRYELYNLVTDPAEQENIYGKKMAEVKEMKIQLDKVMKLIRENKRINSTGKVKLDKKEQEKLKSLGYIK